MKTAALTSLILAVAASTAMAGTPPVRVDLSEDTYAPGDHARVHVKLAQDGYLVVLQRDAGGHVRVLFPLDPSDTALVQAGHDFEVRGRGDRDAFVASADDGNGVVLAARANRPFDFSAFTRNGRWDLASLAAVDSTNVAPEGVLLDIADLMSNGRPFQYDDVTYTVAAPSYSRVYPEWYSPWPYAPWGYGRWYYDPWDYPGFGFGLQFTPRTHRLESRARPDRDRT